MNAVRTVIAPSAVEAIVADRYGLHDVTRCVLHSVTIHDHYLVDAGDRRLVMRIYNAEHSATPDHPAGLFELELLAFLAAQHQPVAAPHRLLNGFHFGRIDASEGSRRYALFDHADGGMMFPPSVSQARVLGSKVAELHRAMDGFSGGPPAAALELGALIEDSTSAILNAIGEARAGDRAFLKSLSADLQRELHAVDALPRQSGVYGIVGEHFTGTNNHWQDDQTPIFFSFSACGRGWRALDVACFYWQTLLFGIPPAVWMAYLEGYEGVRGLHDAERAALLSLAKLKMLQTMAFHTGLTKWMGSAFQDGAYWDRHVGPLRRWHESAVSK